MSSGNCKVDNICHALLPNAGLGNKLFIFAKAFIFSRTKNIPLVVTGWTQLSKGDFLKGGHLRLYLNYFIPIMELGWIKWIFYKIFYTKWFEPNIDIKITKKNIYVFNKMPHWADYFKDLKNFRDDIRNFILINLTKPRQKELKSCPAPVICIHIRLGDFRPLKSGEDFKMVGQVRTPLCYFVNLIQEIRRCHGSLLPVTILSNGKKSLLKKILNLPNVKMGPSNSAIIDIFMMAKSKILITSAGSTFSYWGGFLGDNAVIMHQDHIHASIRHSSINDKFYEGPAVGKFEQWPELLIKNIRDLDCVQE